MTTDKGILRSFFDALVESRARQAERQIAMYRPFFTMTDDEPVSRL